MEFISYSSALLSEYGHLVGFVVMGWALIKVFRKRNEYVKARKNEHKRSGDKDG